MMTTMMMMAMGLLTLTIALGEESCDLDKADQLVMKNFDLKKAAGLWPMKFIYRWNEVYFQDVKLLAYDHLYNSNCTPTHVKKYRLIIIRDESCEIEEKTYKQAADNPGVLRGAKVTLDPTGSYKQETITVLATDYEKILVYKYALKTGKGTFYNMGILVRNLTAPVDWSAADRTLRAMCKPAPESGNWSNLFVRLNFDPEAKCDCS